MMVVPAFKKAIKEGCYIAVLVEVEHPNGIGYFWEGVGELEYEDNTYKGAALVGGISQSRRSVDLRIDEMTLWLNGLDSGEVEQLDDNVKNRVCRIRMAALNENRRVVAVHEAEEILLDYQRDVIGENGETSLEVKGQAGLWMLERSTDAVYSQESATAEFPDEVGFTYIPSLQNKDTPWTQS
jgi:hypothetical protein